MLMYTQRELGMSYITASDKFTSKANTNTLLSPTRKKVGNSVDSLLTADMAVCKESRGMPYITANNKLTSTNALLALIRK